jgi:hypothetical protein
MNWKGYERKQSWPSLRYYPGIWLEVLRKTTKTSVRVAKQHITNGQVYTEYNLKVWDKCKVEFYTPKQ